MGFVVLAMKRSQVLASGLIVRQDFSDAVRAIFFQTEYEEFPYATDGGTLFVINFRGRRYGLTCKHAFGTFDPRQIFITQDKLGVRGTKPAPIKGRYFPSAPIDEAVETDVVDLCAIDFEDDISSDFFGGAPYIIDEGTVGTSKLGHRLLVAGALKAKSEIMAPDITIGYCNLEFRDSGASTFDPFLRQAIAQFRRPEFDSVTGISGSPVFDQTANVLCGMVARGTMAEDRCTIYYIDIADIVRFLEGINAGAASIYYTKFVERRVSLSSGISGDA
jgi:hypothetical protein